MRGSRVGPLIRLLLTLALLALLFARVDLGEVLRVVRQANPRYLLPVLLLYLCAIAANTLKWGVLLRAQGVRVPWPLLARYTFVGLFFNNLLPTAVGGDVARGFGLRQYTQRGADAAVSIAMDRLIGLIALTGSALLAVLVAQLGGVGGSTALGNAFLVSLVATTALLVALALLLSRRTRAAIQRALAWSVARLPLLRPLLLVYGNVAAAIGAYRHQPAALLVALTIAFGTWLFSNLVNYLLSLSLAGAGAPPLSLLHIFLFNPLIGLSQLVPLSIGGLGLNQNLYDAFYHQLLGYDGAHVAAVSFLMQLVVYLTSLPGGLLWWTSRGSVPTDVLGATAESPPARP